jgi:hypothetical protein
MPFRLGLAFLLLLSACSLLRNLDDYGSGGTGAEVATSSVSTGGASEPPPFAFLRTFGLGEAVPLGYGPLDMARSIGMPRVEPSIRIAAATDGSTWAACVTKGILDPVDTDELEAVGEEGRESLFLVRFDARGKVLAQTAHAVDSDAPGSVVLTGVTALRGAEASEVVLTLTLVGPASVFAERANGSVQRAESTDTEPLGLDGLALRFDATGHFVAGARFGGGVGNRSLASAASADPESGVWVAGGFAYGFQVTGLDGVVQACPPNNSRGSFIARLDAAMSCLSLSTTVQNTFDPEGPLQIPLSIDVSDDYVVIGGYVSGVTQFALDPNDVMSFVTLTRQDEETSGFVIRYRRSLNVSEPLHADWGVSINNGDAGARHRVVGVAVSRSQGDDPGSVFVAGTIEQRDVIGDQAPIKTSTSPMATQDCVLGPSPLPARDHDAVLLWLRSDGSCRTSTLLGEDGTDDAVGMALLDEKNGVSRVFVPIRFPEPRAGFGAIFAAPTGPLGGVAGAVFDANGISLQANSFLFGSASHIAAIAAHDNAITIAGSSQGPAPGIDSSAPSTLFMGRILREYFP